MTVFIIQLLLLTAVVVSWSVRHRHVPKEQRPFLGLLLLAFLTEVTGFVLMRLGRSNAEVYQAYALVELLVLLLFAQGVLRKRWSLLFVAGTIVLCAGLFHLDLRGSTGFHILHANSLLVGWGAITLLFAKLLLDLANNSTLKLWHDQRFWVYLSVFLFLAPAIPYIGLLNLLYERDPELALRLYVILHVLFFVRYGCALVAGLLLKHRNADAER